MPLSAGTRIGSYEILASVGAGGMGEVYKARDTKLGRDVAIKVLPEAFARDADRMARFEREAQVLASLNHPHIAAIYGLEESDGMCALVMELVEGPTLDEQIGGRAIALEETLPIAKQITEALEYAHEKGIIHRDLKPANVKLTADGHVKVLDFGLAKALEAPAPAVGNPSISPTLTIEGTRAGVILGTAAYMAPEQARGTMLDKRADIWSFGVVLYEMLTGKQPFAGATVSDTLAAVLKTEPDLTLVPVRAQKLLRRCLDKERKRRLRDIGDVWELLEEAPQIIAPSQSRLGWLAWAVAALSLAGTASLAFVHFREAPPQRTVLRYTIPAPENTTNLHSFAISPDGRLLVMSAQVKGKRQLWLRALDALQAQPMPGTDDATYPFWSPDSRYIGFFAQGKLKKIAASGGPAQALCDASIGQGGSWNRDDVILFSPSTSSGVAIQRVSATGGVPADVTVLKGISGISVFPVFLPDGRHFLYVVDGVSAEKNGVYLSSLDGKENRRVLADVSNVAFASGRLLFIRENTLMSQFFDPASGQTKGEVSHVAEGVSFTFFSYAPVSVSENGVLLYESGGLAGGNQMAWYDRDGKLLGSIGGTATTRVWDPAISPDGKSVAFRRASAGSDLWLWDLTRGAEQRFTTDALFNSAPVWSPQSDRIVFSSDRSGPYNLYQKATSGTGKDELLLASSNNKVPIQWSRDGRFVVYSEHDPKTKLDIWVLPMKDGERKAIPFLHSNFNESQGQLSPDSQWMTYTSDKTGQPEVYVRPFPSGEGEWKISIAGGEQPRWRGDGKELFLIGADGKMMAVAVKALAGAKPTIGVSTPQPLFDTHLARHPSNLPFQYDLTADGKRFLVNTTGSRSTSTPFLNVMVNWDAGLKK
jgi:serine/threonine protein kinase/Tol biopolymer transport system component